MRLKIISNGERLGTKVVNAETGEELERVVVVTWSVDANDWGRVRCELLIEDVEAEIEDEAVVTKRVR